MCSQLSLHTGLGLGKSLLNSKLHFSAVGLLDGFMELFPAQTGQIWMSHEEEVAELHPAQCQSHYTWPQARILFGFCLCKDGGFPGLSGVAGFPVKCQMAAAAPGVELPAQTLCRAWQSAQSCSGQLCPQFPKPSVPLGGLSAHSPVCPSGTGLRRNSLFLEGAPITSTAAQGTEPLE